MRNQQKETERKENTTMTKSKQIFIPYFTASGKQYWYDPAKLELDEKEIEYTLSFQFKYAKDDL